MRNCPKLVASQLSAHYLACDVGWFSFLLFSTVRGARPGKNVQLSEGEIRGLCLKSREIFLSQPILLELEAPLKICGEYFCVNIFLGWLKTKIRFFVILFNNFNLLNLLFIYKSWSDLFKKVLTLSKK